MNSALIISSMNATNAFSNNHESYFQYITHVGKENGITPTDYLEIREQAKKRLEELDNLKKELSKLEGVIHPDTYKKLMSAIENEEALTSMLQSDCEQYLETQDEKFSESVLAGLEYENECSMELMQSISTVERQMGIMIVGSVLNQKITLEEVMQISSSLEKGTTFQKQMEDLENYMKRDVPKENKRVVTAETTSQLQPVQSTQKQTTEMQSLVGPAANPKEPTLVDKINQVQFSKDKNMVAEVQELTVEERMAQIAGVLASLSGKEKLSLKDMIQIHTLQEEQVQLEAYVASLAEQKLSRSEVKRNKKMGIATDKIEQNKKLIADSMKNSKQYNSKIMRFFSARYQEQLANQVARLREKRGILQQQQRKSAVAKYNKVSGKITRSSKILGTIKGMTQFKNAKLDELRALRNQVVTEFQNLKQDMRRFTSNREMIPLLQQNPVIMLDQPMSLTGRQMEQTSMLTN